MTASGGFDFTRLGEAQNPPPVSGSERAGDHRDGVAQPPRSPFDPPVGQPGSDGWSLPGPGAQGPVPGAAGVGPPLPLLGAALLAALVGGAAAVPSLDGVVVYAVGWLLSGPVALALLVLFSRRDAARQSVMTYSAPGWLNGARLLLVVFVLLALVANALRIAVWAGRL